jgi:hypothetical protein
MSSFRLGDEVCMSRYKKEWDLIFQEIEEKAALAKRHTPPEQFRSELLANKRVQKLRKAVTESQFRAMIEEVVRSRFPEQD